MKNILIFLFCFGLFLPTFTENKVEKTVDKKDKKTFAKRALPSFFMHKRKTYMIKMPTAVAGVRGKASTAVIKKKLVVELNKSFFDKHFYWSPAEVECFIFKNSSKNSQELGTCKLKWGENHFEVEYLFGENISFVFKKNKDKINTKAISLQELKGENLRIVLD
jgi:hypothetical protein